MNKVRIVQPVADFTVGQSYEVIAKNSLNYLLKSDIGEQRYVAKSRCQLLDTNNG